MAAGPLADAQVTLALQGAGAHGALTWGVLNAFLRDGRLDVTAGFRRYWRWSSRRRGHPQFQRELRALIRRMSLENRLCGAPRIHDEMLKLGFEVSQSSVAKYMVGRRGPPSQSWRAFLRNHARDIAAMDLFALPTIGFDILYAFVIVRLPRRALVWIGVTKHPTAEWIASQITEAFPWNEAPRYLIRDRDGCSAPSSRADCVRWGSATRRSRPARLGKMFMPSG